MWGPLLIASWDSTDRQAIVLQVKSDFGVLQSSMSVLESESSLLKEELEAANEKLRLSEASSAEVRTRLAVMVSRHNLRDP